MGAGCYYTSEIDGEKTYWIDFDDIEDEVIEDFAIHVEDVFEVIKSDFPKSWHFNVKSKEISNGLYLIKTESTHYGDGLVFNWHVNPGIENSPAEKLAKANYRKNWEKVGKILAKYYEVRIATGGYTSTKIFN